MLLTCPASPSEGIHVFIRSGFNVPIHLLLLLLLWVANIGKQLEGFIMQIFDWFPRKVPSPNRKVASSTLSSRFHPNDLIINKWSRNKTVRRKYGMLFWFSRDRCLLGPLSSADWLLRSYFLSSQVDGKCNHILMLLLVYGAGVH